VWTGVSAVAALLLALAGALKARDPDGTVRAMRAVGLPVGPWWVRLGAVAEAALGLTALIVGGALMAAVAASYTAFAGFVMVSRRVPEAASCGCLGSRGSRPSVRHVVFDLAMAAGCILAAATSPPSLVHLIATRPAWGVPVALVVVTGTCLAAQVLSDARARDPREATSREVAPL
jgi:uncharacterized membrane protein YphA (DoxX/SURF4 family)